MYRRHRIIRKSPFEGNDSAWQVSAENQEEALVVYFRTLEPAQGKFERIYLKGLKEQAKYSVQECFGAKMDCGVYYGDELMYAGFSVSDCAAGIPGIARQQQGDYFSRLFYLKKIEE
jgi:alpha-galactosidase